MDISLVHTGLAAGAALAAVPVILHLFMKQTPKHIIFPALRLIRERQRRSKKRIKIKNWLLLLARMALLALMALALARPRMMSQTSFGDSDVPAAIGLVFDTSLSMEYTERDKTRLDEAKALALDKLAKTPSSSQVFVIDSAEPLNIPLSPATARKRVEALTTRPVNRSLNAAVGVAYAAVAESDRPLRQVYVFTDLARSAWDLDRPVENLDKAKTVKSGIMAYVLSLTPKDAHDVAVVSAKPSAEVVTEGEAVEIRGRIHSLGPETKGVAKLWLDDLPRGEKAVTLPANGDVEVSFVIPNVDPNTPLHQGRIEFSGAPDPLKFDDIRYFTFALKPAIRVLVVSDEAIDADFITAAIDPDPATLPAGTARPFRVERIRSSQFPDHASSLSKQYRVIFLNNVEQLGEDDWARLRGFVLEGGGLVVGVGNRCQGENYRSMTARQLLPGSIEEIVEVKEGTTFAEIADLTHPVFSAYEKELRALLPEVPIGKYWKTSIAEGSRVLLSYADKAPALAERVFKGPSTGRVMLWTTPLSRRPEPNSPEAWNEFPIKNWAYLGLMDQSVHYLAGTTEESLNFEAGKDVILPIDPTRRFKNYTVQGPDRKNSDPTTPTANTDSLEIVAQDRGQWNVIASGEDGKTETLGFSVNAPADETRYVPLEKPDLEKLFGGKENEAFALAVDAKSVRTAENIHNVGVELFPWVMMIIMVIVTVESVLANRFYREAAPRPALSEAR
jgi:hypothetical protein